MPLDSRFTDLNNKPIGDESLIRALNELSRSINISTTYGKKHPAVEAAVVTAEVAMNTLFSKSSQVIIGSFNGMLTIDEQPVSASGTLLKSMERRLTRLQITGLKICKGINRYELLQLIDLLSYKEAADFQAGIDAAGMSHISAKKTEFKAVQENQTVANTIDLMSTDDSGILILDDETHNSQSESDVTIHIEQIVAFLKGDIELGDDPEINKELSELASDTAKLGKMIMEAVAVRQSSSLLSGESLGDIVIGCLRRTYNGLREQSVFRDAEGKDELRKTLLLLEENLLEKMRALTGDSDPELDREIVQAIRDMDENLGFEAAALKYMEHRKGIEQKKLQLQQFISDNGVEAAEGLLADTPFPQSEWRRIVVESNKDSGQVTKGISTLTTVFERLESLMLSDTSDGTTVKDLLGQATENLDDTIFTTKEKLDVLSQQLKEGEAGTIGGHGRNMTQDELLASLAEVAQELMQPLTAITASLEMMLHGFVGEISHDQRDLLGLAANSGEHLQYLMKELIDIVGCPANKGIDKRYHTTSEKVVLMKDVEGQEHLPLSYFQ
jgi:hypothetical protein